MEKKFLKKCVCGLILVAFCLSTMTGCGLFGNKEDEPDESMSADVESSSDVETDTETSTDVESDVETSTDVETDEETDEETDVETSTETDSETVTETEELTEESETLNDSDTLGDYDFDGAKYNVLSRASTVREWDHNKNEHGTTVANAVYTRNQLVQQRLNVKIVVEEIGGWWNNDWGKSPWFAKYGTVTQSGWSEYSIITGHFSLAQCAAVRGYCMDMTTLEVLDVEKEWWSKQFYERCNLKGKFYVLVGDATYSMYEEMYIMFFNETLAESILKDGNGDPINLYELVRNDEWTWEKLKQYMMLVSNTDATLDDEKEYGYITNTGALRSYASAFEMEYADSKEIDGYLIYSFPQSPIGRTVNILDEMSSFFTITAINSVKLKAADDECNQIFSEGRSLFYSQRLGQVTKIGSAMATGQEYGILPYPKYDEDQLEYHVDCYDGVSGITVPRNIKDTEMVGVVTEALGMYSYQEVTPAFLDTVLNGRYLASSDMADMMKIIRESFDIGFFNAYSGAMGTPHVFSATDVMFSANNGQGYASYYAGCLSQYTAHLAAFYKAHGIIVD